MPALRLVLASNNAKKLSELRLLLGELALHFRTHGFEHRAHEPQPFLDCGGQCLVALVHPLRECDGGVVDVLHHRRGLLDIKASALIAFGIFLGVWFGAKLAIGTPPATLQRLFAVFLVFMAVRMWIGAGR
mgnify:CR=1 FL=1